MILVLRSVFKINMNNNSQSAQDIIQKLKLAAKNRRKVEADKEKSYLSSFDAAKNIHNIDAPNERYMESIVRNSQSRAKSRPRPNIAGDEKLNTAQTRLPKRRFRGKSINKINFVKKIDFVKQNIEEAKYPSNSRINTQSMNYQPTITHQSRNQNLMMGNTSFNNTSFVHNNLYNYDLPVMPEEKMRVCFWRYHHQ